MQANYDVAYLQTVELIIQRNTSSKLAEHNLRNAVPRNSHEQRRAVTSSFF